MAIASASTLQKQHRESTARAAIQCTGYNLTTTDPQENPYETSFHEKLPLLTPSGARICASLDYDTLFVHDSTTNSFRLYNCATHQAAMLKMEDCVPRGLENVRVKGAGDKVLVMEDDVSGPHPECVLRLVLHESDVSRERQRGKL